MQIVRCEFFDFNNIFVMIQYSICFKPEKTIFCIGDCPDKIWISAYKIETFVTEADACMSFVLYQI